MKTKIIIIAISLLTLISCADPGGDPVYDGFTSFFFNKTSISYTNAKLIVGGMKNGNFVATDSIIIIPKIKIGSPNRSYFIDENRWKPNLEKIKNLSSERCYFMLKLTENRNELIKRYQQNTLFSLLLPDNNNFKGDFGSLYIYIYDDRVIGNAAEEID